MLRSLGLLVLRASAGTILVGHGYAKLFGGKGHKAPHAMEHLYGDNFAPSVEGTGPDNFAHNLEAMKVPAPHLSAYAAGLAEFGGGLSFLLGYRTRTMAPVVIFNMVTAIRTVHWKKGLYGEGGFEFPLMLAAAAGTLLLTGPGALSIDAALGAASHITDMTDPDA